MTFATALRTFLETEEEAQEVNIDVWDRNIPFMDEIAAFQGRNLYRGDVFAAAREDDVKGAVFALVWGYPDGHTFYRNKGMPINLQTAMLNLEPVARTIHSIRHYGTTDKNPLRRLNANPGLRTASTSKIAYFANLEHRQHRLLILDQQVMRAILTEDFSELNDLRSTIAKRQAAAAFPDGFESRMVDAPASYPAYIEGMGKLAKSLDHEFEADEIERFLFELGREIGRTPNTRQWQHLSRSVII